jgi:TonB family protein
MAVAVGFGALVSPAVIGFLAAPVGMAQPPDTTRTEQPGTKPIDRPNPAALNPLDPDSDGVMPPVVLSTLSFRPKPPAQAQVGGELVLSIIVGIDGKASDIAVVRSVSPDQDKRVVEALQNARFAPGKLGDMPVPVRVPFLMKFEPIGGWPEPGFGAKPQTTNRRMPLFDFSTGAEKPAAKNQAALMRWKFPV